jgi:virulence factor Mce-like protein
MKAISGWLARRGPTAVMGVVFTVLVVGLSVLGVAYGFGAFSTSKTVTATIPEAGPALGPGSEVEYRGVLVGSLGSVRRTLRDAILSIHLDPNQVHNIPAGVTVRLVPRSVFGDLYVDLVPPAHSSGPLQLPANLTADTSTPTTELDQALDAGYQLLTSVQPSKLNATLTAVATALNGRGTKIGKLVEQVESYTSKVAPHTGQLVHDITTVGTVGRELAHDAPDLLATLNDLIATSQTIAKTQPTLTQVLNAGPTVADQTGTLLQDNKVRLRTLVHLLQPVVGVLRGNRARLVTAVEQLRLFLNGAAKALGDGPWLQVTVIPDVSLADGSVYTAADCPRYGSLAGANCPKGSQLTPAQVVRDLKIAVGPMSTTSHGSQPDSLGQRLGIAKVLLAPVLRAIGIAMPNLGSAP